LETIMTTLHRHRSTILGTSALVLLGLALGLALHPLQVAAVPSNGNDGVEGRVTALEQFALEADARLDDLEQDVNQLVIDLVDLMIVVEELQECTGCEGGGGPPPPPPPECEPTGEEVCNGIDDDCDGTVDEGFSDGQPCETEDGLPGETQFCECVPFGP